LIVLAILSLVFHLIGAFLWGMGVGSKKKIYSKFGWIGIWAGILVTLVDSAIFPAEEGILADLSVFFTALVIVVIIFVADFAIGYIIGRGMRDE
jgi:hypothetical protein